MVDPRHRGKLFHLCISSVLLWHRLALASKILATPLPGAESHTFILAKVAAEMVSRGHEVMFAIAETDAETISKINATGMKILTYNQAYSKQQMKELVRDTRTAIANNFLGSLESFLVYYDCLMRFCHHMLSDTTAMDAMREYDPDLIIGDMLYPCTSAVSELLFMNTDRPRKIPRVLISALPILDPLVPGVLENYPNPLAYIPQMGTALSNDMNLLQRTFNVLMWYGCKIVEQLRCLPKYTELARAFNFSMWRDDVVHGTAMFIFNMDLALEWPRALPPTIKFVGALLPAPAKPLPPAFETILANAEAEGKGVILASMGTLCNFGTEEFRQIARALSSLNYTVVWKVAAGDLPGNATVESLGIGANVKVVQWCPQQDLLGDPRVKAFVTHGGLNSIYEAIYHKTPIIGIPVFGDQPDNVAKAVYRGIGLGMPPGRITADALAAAIIQVAEQPQYREAVTKLSKRMRAHRSTPVQQAGDWIEHVLETDGEIYLNTPEHKIRWYSRLLIDVHVLLLLFTVVGGTALYLGTRFVLDKLQGTPFKPFYGTRWENTMVVAVVLATAAGAIFVTGSAASFT